MTNGPSHAPSSSRARRPSGRPRRPGRAGVAVGRDRVRVAHRPSPLAVRSHLVDAALHRGERPAAQAALHRRTTNVVSSARPPPRAAAAPRGPTGSSRSRSCGRSARPSPSPRVELPDRVAHEQDLAGQVRVVRPGRGARLDQLQPVLRYGPTVVATAVVRAAISASAVASSESATTSGQSAAAAQPSRTRSSFSSDRPPSPIRSSRAARARYSAVSFPTNPVARRGRVQFAVGHGRMLSPDLRDSGVGSGHGVFWRARRTGVRRRSGSPARAPVRLFRQRGWASQERQRVDLQGLDRRGTRRSVGAGRRPH